LQLILSNEIITIIRNIEAKRLLAAPSVRGGTLSADFCAEKAKPQIIAASTRSRGEINLFKLFINVSVRKLLL
jgi:hypothetical protein